MRAEWTRLLYVLLPVALPQTLPLWCLAVFESLAIVLSLTLVVSV